MTVIDHPKYAVPIAARRRVLSPPTAAGGRSQCRGLWARFRAAWRQRADLAALAGRPDRELADIGLTREDLPFVAGPRKTGGSFGWYVY